MLNHLIILIMGAGLSTSMTVGKAGLEFFEKRKACIDGPPKACCGGVSDGCYTFCDVAPPVQEYGPPQKVSQQLNCTIGTCRITHLESVTVTETNSVGGGIDIGGIINAETSYEYSKSLQTSDSFQFELEEGEQGYVIFAPLMNKVCGRLGIWGFSITSTGGWCVAPDDPPEKIEENACGSYPAKLPDGKADGSFALESTKTGQIKTLRKALTEGG